MSLEILAEINGIVYAIFGALAGVVLSYIVVNQQKKVAVEAIKTKSDAVVKEEKLKHENQIKTAQLENKTEMIQLRNEAEKDFDKTRRELRDTERDVAKRETQIERQTESNNGKKRHLDSLEKKISQKEQTLQGREHELDDIIASQKSELTKISGLTKEDAHRIILDKLEDDVKHEASALIEKHINKAKEEAERKSNDIIINALQRYAASQTCENTVSTVDIPDDDMKGRVIGREGRNIRAFEKETGVDVIIDDTPGMVVISSFNPIRREIARITLNKLIKDGRIHPTRIEEVVTETIAEMDEKCTEIGKKVLLEVNISGVNSKMLPYLGKLSYRTSYGQNILRHSVEVAFLCQAMAEELGLDGVMARRAGLLHDIGKAADQEEEGGHPEIGYQIGKRCNEGSEVLNAIQGHHGDVPATSPYTALVAAADAMSAARPGARRETMERYIKRLEDLESVATSFDGAKSAYAIQAGREVRVIVNPESIDDAGAWKLARDIAAKVQEELTYPGEVKVTLLREIRCIEYAR